MTITIVTSYQEGPSDHFVAAVEGKLTPEQRRDLAERLALQPDDAVGFCEVELQSSTDKPIEIRNIYHDGCITRCGRDLIVCGQP